MNEFERKLYLKYRNIENMTQLLCLKLYRLRLFVQVNGHSLKSGPETRDLRPETLRPETLTGP